MATKHICLLAHARDLPEGIDEVPPCFEELHALIVRAGDRVSVAYVSDAGICEVRPGTQNPDPAATFEPTPGCPQRLVGPERTQAAYHVYSWLKSRAFDCVYATGGEGLLFYVLMAREQGLAFGDTVFCVHLFMPTLLRRYQAQTPVDEIGDLVSDHLERTVSRLADCTVTSCEKTRDWASSNGWALPTGIKVLAAGVDGNGAESAGAVRGVS